MKVFVYGTLLKGMSRSHSLSTSRFEGFGVIRGSLYDLGSYPGIVDFDGSVYGEIYDIDSSTLVALDHIEGYDINYPESSLYSRKEVQTPRSLGF